MTDYSDCFQIKGQIALVTGAASGLGRAICIGLAQHGAKVAAVDLNPVGLEELSNKLNTLHADHITLTVDVSNRSEVDGAVQHVWRHFGGLDILINNAGLGARAPAQDMTDEQWDIVLDVNLKGTFFFCRELGRLLLEAKRKGKIINMSSVTGLVGVTTGNANYAASKGGMIAMSRCLALEWAPYGITVNCLAPSHVRTPLVETLIQQQPETGRYFLSNIPLGRLGETKDIVGPILFLASPAAEFITGQVLAVDGGHTAK